MFSEGWSTEIDCAQAGQHIVRRRTAQRDSHQAMLARQQIGAARCRAVPAIGQRLCDTRTTVEIFADQEILRAEARDDSAAGIAQPFIRRNRHA